MKDVIMNFTVEHVAGDLLEVCTENGAYEATIETIDKVVKEIGGTIQILPDGRENVLAS